MALRGIGAERVLFREVERRPTFEQVIREIIETADGTRLLRTTWRRLFTGRQRNQWNHGMGVVTTEEVVEGPLTNTRISTGLFPTPGGVDETIRRLPTYEAWVHDRPPPRSPLVQSPRIPIPPQPSTSRDSRSGSGTGQSPRISLSPQPSTSLGPRPWSEANQSPRIPTSPQPSPSQIPRPESGAGQIPTIPSSPQPPTSKGPRPWSGDGQIHSIATLPEPWISEYPRPWSVPGQSPRIPTSEPSTSQGPRPGSVPVQPRPGRTSALGKTRGEEPRGQRSGNQTGSPGVPGPRGGSRSGGGRIQESPTELKYTNMKKETPYPEMTRLAVPSPARAYEDVDDFSGFAQECLHAHNMYRASHGVPPLELSKKLCEASEEHAKLLARTGQLQHRSFLPFGENLYSVWSPNPDFKVTGGAPVDKWYAEMKDFNFGQEPQDMTAGHFTQVVWRGSERLGVGHAKSNTGHQYVVCIYEPPGNVIGNFSKQVPPVESRGTKLMT